MKKMSRIILSLMVILPFSAYASDCELSSLESMIKKGEQEAAIAFIRSGNAPINELGCSRPLIRAMYHDNLIIFTELIKAGADVNLGGYHTDEVFYDEAPLFFAAIKRPEFLKLLIASGANINGQTKYGETALMEAVEMKRVENVKLLIEAGADKDFPRYLTGETALLRSLKFCEGDNLEIEKMLITSGADLLRADPSGVTPLMAATSCGHVEFVELILQRAASSINTTDNYGKTALAHLRTNYRGNNSSWRKIAIMLIEAGATE